MKQVAYVKNQLNFKSSQFQNIVKKGCLSFSQSFIIFMKLLLFFLLFPQVLIAQLISTDSLKLTGQIEGMQDGYIYFAKYGKEEIRWIDSVMVKNQHFEYVTKHIGYTDRFFIKKNPQNSSNNDSLNNVRVPIENGIMSIKLKIGAFSKFKLNGCESCHIIKLFDSLNRLRYDLSVNIDLINEELLDKKSARLTIQNYDSLERRSNLKIWLDYFRSIPNQNTKTYLLYRLAPNISLVELKSLAAELDIRQFESFFGFKLLKFIKYAEEEIEKSKIRTAVLLGSTAFKFESFSYSGDTVILKEYFKKGITVLDFWASWCKPCRNTHPQLRNIYSRYRNDNLNIISISVDSNVENWKKAIQEDSLTQWANILSYKNTTGIKIDEKYDINSYPTKIIINNDGVIIGVFDGDNLSEFELKLKEIFKH